MLLFLLECYLFSFSQNIFKGKVLNKSTNAPMSYVNVGIINKNIGTVSDINGRFNIELTNNINSDDSIKFSMVGYKDRTFSVASFKQCHFDTIFLEKKIIELQEIKIFGKKQKTKIFGNKTESKLVCTGFESNKLGSEVGIIIKIKKSPTYLQNFNFNILSNKYDSLFFRLNIYNIKDGKPNKNILNQNIFVSTNKKTGEVSVDLRKYNIVVYNDFFISLEWIKNSGKENEMGLLFSSKLFNGGSFFRKTSQGEWKKNSKAGIGFYTTVKY